MKAYNQLYELLSDGLHRFSYSLVKSHEIAEEIVSDVYIKVWQIRGKLMEIENLQVYLYTIAKNFSLNYLPKNYKNKIINLDTIDVEAMIEISGPAEMCISADLVKQIRQVKQHLPPQSNLIFQFLTYSGINYKQSTSIL